MGELFAKFRSAPRSIMEDELFRSRARLFQMEAGGGAGAGWKHAGSGDVRILANAGANVRIVMRDGSTGVTLLNFGVAAGWRMTPGESDSRASKPSWAARAPPQPTPNARHTQRQLKPATNGSGGAVFHPLRINQASGLPSSGLRDSTQLLSHPIPPSPHPSPPPPRPPPSRMRDTQLPARPTTAAARMRSRWATPCTRCGSKERAPPRSFNSGCPWRHPFWARARRGARPHRRGG
jgi:hypothetical protein